MNTVKRALIGIAALAGLVLLSAQGQARSAQAFSSVTEPEGVHKETSGSAPGPCVEAKRMAGEQTMCGSGCCSSKQRCGDGRCH
jgi:hypothetical protein